MADQLSVGYAPVFNNSGVIASGGSATFYETGTTTLVSIFSDAAATIPLSNPVTLGADGRPSGGAQVFYAGTLGVKQVIKDSEGNTITTVDPCITSPADANTAALVIFTPISENTATNVQDAIENVSTAAGVAYATHPNNEATDVQEALDNLAGTRAGVVATYLSGTNDLVFSADASAVAVAGMRLLFRVPDDNTGPVTIKINDWDAADAVTVTGDALPAEYIRGYANIWFPDDGSPFIEAIYNGTEWTVQRRVVAETGSSGTATLYADGTMDAYHSLTLDGFNAANLSKTWTFPRAFIATPSILATLGDISGTAVPVGEMVPTRAFNPSATAVTVAQARRTGGTNFTSGDEVEVSVYARGRWY